MLFNFKQLKALGYHISVATDDDDNILGVRIMGNTDGPNVEIIFNELRIAAPDVPSDIINTLVYQVAMKAALQQLSTIEPDGINDPSVAWNRV